MNKMRYSIGFDLEKSFRFKKHRKRLERILKILVRKTWQSCYAFRWGVDESGKSILLDPAVHIIHTKEVCEEAKRVLDKMNIKARIEITAKYEYGERYGIILEDFLS